MGVDFFALSFVRRREDLEPVREHLRARGGEVPLIAKIEKPQAAANAEEIVEAADGVMIARGDLGIELPIEEVPLVQKRLLALAGRRAKPTITATQMLESMVHSTRPDAGRGGRRGQRDLRRHRRRDALPGDRGRATTPCSAVEMMASIAEATERELPYGRWLAERGPQANNQYHAIAFGAVGAVYQLGLKAIVVADPDRHHRAADLLLPAPGAGAGPVAQPDVVRRCAAVGRGPALHDEPQDTLDLIEACAQAARRGLVEMGDTIGITAGLPAGGAAGPTCSRSTRSSRAERGRSEWSGGEGSAVSAVASRRARYPTANSTPSASGGAGARGRCALWRHSRRPPCCTTA